MSFLNRRNALEHTATGMEQSPVFQALMKKAASAPMPELRGSPKDPPPVPTDKKVQDGNLPPEGRRKPTQIQLPSAEFMPLLISGLIMGVVWVSTEYMSAK